MKLTSSHAAVLANLIFKRLDERLKRVESLSDKNNFELQSLKSEMEMIKDEAAFLSQEERPTIDTSIPLLEELKLAWLGLVEGYYIPLKREYINIPPIVPYPNLMYTKLLSNHKKALQFVQPVYIGSYTF